MKHFQKLGTDGWYKNTFYETTKEEYDILQMEVKTQEEYDLVQSTIASANSKAYVVPTEDELTWCEGIYNHLMVCINSAEMQQYKLVGINLTQKITTDVGIEFNGILNYFCEDEYCQYRF